MNVKSKDDESNFNDEVEFLIKTEKDALHAMNLSRLLTKNWVEYPNSYKICSKIPDRAKARVQDILGDNRYQ